MGSSLLLRSHKVTIVTDSDGQLKMRFSLTESIELIREEGNQEHEESEVSVHLVRDSMISYNERGCDEIMQQFVSDLDLVMTSSVESIG